LSYFKFIFTGTPGSGKTSAISALSDNPPITSAASVSQELSDITSGQKISMDFGEITLKENIKVHLYGIPGQERFRFLWETITRGSIGLIILVDNSRPSPLDDLDIYLDNFASFISETGAVVGITHMDTAGKCTTSLEDYYTHLEQRGITLPVYQTDARDLNDVLFLLDTLMAIIEYSQLIS